MRHACTRGLGLAFVSSLALAADVLGFQSPAAQRLNLGLRGVYFVPNEGQWSDAGVIFGYRSRGLDIAFRESSFTMHLAREMPEASPTRERGHRAAHAAAEPSPDREGVVLDDRWSDALHSAHAAAEPSPDREGVVLDDRWNDALHSAHATAEPSPDREGVVLDERRGDALLSPQTEPMVDPRQPQRSLEHLTLAVTFPGSNEVIPVAAQPRSAKFNYFVGDDESKWASNVPSFGEVVYENLYDGIDLHITGAPDSSGVLKYEFHVQPGADWSQIRISYDGIDSLCIDEVGSLHIATSMGTLTDAAPLVWQECLASRDGKGAVLDDRSPRPLPDGRGSSDHREPIPARFELASESTYTITLDGPVDPTREVVIDPEVEWMYYLGGSADEVAQAIKIGPNGTLLTVGETTSVDFEGRNNSYFGGATDGFLANMTQAGELAWITYFGGNNEERNLNLGLDDTGILYICGTTLSNDLPGRHNNAHGLEDGFVARVSRTGNLHWTSYVGGSSADSCADLAVSADGRLYVTGSTESIDFEGRNNSTHDNHWHYGDAYLAVMDRLGALQWMTYLGGEGKDEGTAIVADPSGDLFLIGQTTSVSFEGQINNNIGFTDAFALRITRDGESLWMRYFGGAEDEFGSGVVLDDRQEYLYIAGLTASPQFEGQINSHHGGDTYQDGYLLKVSVSGELDWMVFLGGSEADLAYSATIDSDGQIIVAGSTASSNFEGRINDHHGGYNDAFVLARSPSGDLGEMIYTGGSDSERARSCAADGFGRVYVSGSTKSPTFDASLNSNHGAMDAFVLRVVTVAGLRLRVVTACPSGGPSSVTWFNATPSAPTALLFARAAGSFTIPNNRPCPGTMLGLGAEQLQVAFTGHSDANGSRTLNATIGPSLCGGYLQLLDLTTCATSNVARIE